MQPRSPKQEPVRHRLSNDAPESQQILADLRARFQSPDYSPPLLPAVALEVHALAQRAEPDLQALVHTIERDATLAADTLRRAQSASFATRIPPRTIEEAVSRIGTNGIRDLVWQVALNGKVFRGRPPISDAMEALRVHSLVVAHISKTVAAHTSLHEDSAFLVGLLHDVGFACALLVLGENRQREFDIALVGDAIAEVHAEAGSTVAGIWKLPQELRWAIAAHQRAELQGHPHPLASIVVLAEQVADDIGHGFLLGGEPVDLPGPAALQRACETLGIKRPALVQIGEQALPIVEKALAG